jgi:hypothetical protein
MSHGGAAVRGRPAGWRPSQYLLVALLLAIGVTFRAGLNYYFVQDDFGFLSRLAQVRSLAQWLSLFLRNDHFYRPVARVLLLGIPFGLFQTSPVGYHVFNLGLHLINTLLVYRLLRALKAAPLSATLGAGVYGFYPAQLTPLVWIAGIQELSVALFLLLSSLAFVAWCRAPRRVVFYGLCLAGYAAALLCKETAVLLPVWLMAVQWHLPGSMPLGRRLARSAAVLAGLGLVTLGYAAVRVAKANVTGDSGPYSISLAPASLWHNAQAYALDLYGLRSIQILSPAALTVATLLGLAVLLAALGPQRWRGLAGLLWCVCFLAPTLILLDRHYSYYFSVATVGVALLVSAAADRLLAAARASPTAAMRRLSEGVLLLALIAWAAYAAARVGEPFDEQSLKAKGEHSRQIMADLARHYPQSLPCTTLVVVGAAAANEAELSEMFMFFYPSVGQVVFEDPTGSGSSSTAAECHYALPAALSLAPVEGWPA